jgi:hypothetical protein
VVGVDDEVMMDPPTELLPVLSLAEAHDVFTVLADVACGTTPESVTSR